MQLFDALPSHIEDALRASINRFGVLVPVVKDQHGETLDGHHRSRIADELGVKYRVDVVTVSSEDEAREIARTLNADRRQLDEEQRRAVVVELRRHGHSYRAIGGALGVSHTQARNDVEAARLETTFQSQDEPERVVRQGGGSYPAKRPVAPPISAEQIDALKPENQRRPTIVTAKNEREAERAQQALASLGDEAPSRVLDVKRAERMAREKESERRRSEPVEPVTVTADVDIRHGDFREILADLEPGSVDAIITDPPYPREFVHLFEDLAELAARVLAPHGVLAAMTGQSHLRDYLSLLDEHLAYRWVGAYVVQGPRNRVHAAKVGTGWKPILLYQRHDADNVPFLLDDLFDSQGDDKQHHHWGQSETGVACLVERLTKPGQLVVDPFLGGGTTAVVCRDLGRRFVGCDVDAAAVSTSRERVA